MNVQHTGHAIRYPVLSCVFLCQRSTFSLQYPLLERPQLRVLPLTLTINMKMEGESETVCPTIGTGCCFNAVIAMVTSVAVIKVWKLTQ